jgi:signal transduction histidine kinase
MQEQARRMREQTEELGRLNAEAERTNRAKDEFLATLSHELRTPINTVVGWAYMLKQGRLSPSQVVSATEAILRNSQLQMRLIDDLLDISRIISGKLDLKLETINLAEIARQFALPSRTAALESSANSCRISSNGSHRLTAPGHGGTAALDLDLPSSDTSRSSTAER